MRLFVITILLYFTFQTYSFEYRSKGVYTLDKINGIDTSVVGFGLPEEYRRKYRRSNPTIIGGSQSKVTGNTRSKTIGNKSPSGTVPVQGKALPTSNTKLTANSLNTDGGPSEETHDTVHDEMIRGIIFVVCLTILVAIFRFVKTYKESTEFTRNGGVAYAFKKIKFSKDSLKNEKSGDDMERVKLIKSE